MSLNISKRMIIRVVVLIMSVAVATQAVLAQSTPPPRPTPTHSDQSTPVRSTPTVVDTPISNETPMRPTPTSANLPPARATPTAHPKPEGKSSEATPVATPNILPVSGGINREGEYGLKSSLALIALGTIVCLACTIAVLRRRHHHHD